MTYHCNPDESQGKGYWVIFTPAGTYIYETEAPTEQQAWKKLLEAASHMPYEGIEGFKERGYEAEFMPESNPKEASHE